MPQIYTTAQVIQWEIQPNCNVKQRWEVLDLDGLPIDVSSGFNVDCQAFQTMGYGSGNGIISLTSVGTWTKGDGFIEAEFNNADMSILPFDTGLYSLFVGETGTMATNRAMVAYGNFSRINVIADVNGGV